MLWHALGDMAHERLLIGGDQHLRGTTHGRGKGEPQCNLPARIRV